jgi:hypothetical protein
MLDPRSREVAQMNALFATMLIVAGRADEWGQLPEQVPANLNDPSYLRPWQARWGAIASPLLWSHAKYLIAAAQGMS